MNQMHNEWQAKSEQISNKIKPSSLNFPVRMRIGKKRTTMATTTMRKDKRRNQRKGDREIENESKKDCQVDEVFKPLLLFILVECLFVS